MPEDEGLRDGLAEQAFGVLVAAAEDGVTNWNVVAHAIVGNQLPVVERYAARRAAEEAAAVERVRAFIDGFAERGGGHVTATDELWIMSISRSDGR
jgi:hypothetical protein